MKTVKCEHDKCTESTQLYGALHQQTVKVTEGNMSPNYRRLRLHCCAACYSLSYELLLPSGAQMLDLILSVQRGDVEIYASAQVKSELQQAACRMKRLKKYVK